VKEVRDRLALKDPKNLPEQTFFSDVSPVCIVLVGIGSEYGLGQNHIGGIAKCFMCCILPRKKD